MGKVEIDNLGKWRDEKIQLEMTVGGGGGTSCHHIYVHLNVNIFIHSIHQAYHNNANGIKPQVT